MKKFFLILFCAFAVHQAEAQTTQKLGYINSQELLSQMPEVAKANKDIEAYAKTYQDQLETMNKDYEKRVQEYQGGEKTMTEAMREVKQNEIVDLQKRMEATQQSAQEKIAAKKQEIYKPLLERADKAIKEVAREKGYDYIFDSSAGFLLFAKEGQDILAFVKTKLNIK